MNLGWLDHAACANDPEPESWFPTVGRTHAAERAIRVCFSCPVRNNCLEFHMAVEDEPLGIVAGLTATQRRQIAVSR